MSDVLGVMQHELVEDLEAASDMTAAAKEVGIRARVLVNSARYLQVELHRKRAYLQEVVNTGDDVDIEQLVEQEEEALSELDVIRDDQYALVAAALSWRHTAADVRGWCEDALNRGASHPHFGAKLLTDLMYVRKVPAAPFRARLQGLMQIEEADRQQNEGGFDARYVETTIVRDLCEQLGWERRMVRRNLGLDARPGPRPGTKSLTMFIDYELASHLARILGLKPREAGI